MNNFLSDSQICIYTCTLYMYMYMYSVYVATLN